MFLRDEILWGVKYPMNLVLKKTTINLLMVPLRNCVADLLAALYKVSAIVTSNLFRFSSSPYEPA